MKIIEQSCISKRAGRKPEDGVVVTADYAAVVDGSTSKSRHQFRPWTSNGRLAMQIVCRYVRHASPGLSCRQFCEGATEAVRRHYHFWQRQRLTQHPEDRLTASAVVFSRVRREVWMIGDCQCLIGGELYENPKPSEAALAAQRAAIIEASPQPWDHFLDHDTAREAILPHMVETMQGQNRDYAVIDGFPIPLQHVRVIPLSFQPFELVLASDGYPVLCPTLAESEERLRWQRENDPLCIGQFKATKGFLHGQEAFDDRSYLRLRV